MTGPVVLTNAEAALVSGGATLQTIDINVMQNSSSTSSETAVSTNHGSISVTAGRFAVRVGVEPGNAAAVLHNVLEAFNRLPLCPY